MIMEMMMAGLVGTVACINMIPSGGPWIPTRRQRVEMSANQKLENAVTMSMRDMDTGELRVLQKRWDGTYIGRRAYEARRDQVERMLVERKERQKRPRNVRMTKIYLEDLGRKDPELLRPDEIAMAVRMYERLMHLYESAWVRDMKEKGYSTPL